MTKIITLKLEIESNRLNLIELLRAWLTGRWLGIGHVKILSITEDVKA